jgi:probable rRNA maturation factor
MGKRSSAEVEVGAAFARDVSVDRLRAVAEFTLHHEQRTAQVTLVITDDLALQQLNRDFLGIDAPTDVLAFSAQEEGEPFVVAPEAEGYLGDVIVSYPRAVAQAAEVGHPVEQELNLLIVHGLLHLLGYDHADEAGKAMMWARQDAILRGL